MSDLRFRTPGESRWFVAYLRYLAQQRESEPTGSRRPGDTYGYISPMRKAQLRGNARMLAGDLIENTEKYPETAEHRMAA